MEEDLYIPSHLCKVETIFRVEQRLISHRYHRHLPFLICPLDGNELQNQQQQDVELQQVRLTGRHLQTKYLEHNHS
ncbi:hypothetical protein D9M71_809330 [compost metagenome]